MYSFELYATIISPYPICLMFEINPPKNWIRKERVRGKWGEGGKKSECFFLASCIEVPPVDYHGGIYK